MDAGDQRENRGKVDEGKQKPRFGRTAADQLSGVFDFYTSVVFGETPHRHRHHHQMDHHSLSGEGPICDVVSHQAAHSIPLSNYVHLMLQTQNSTDTLLTSVFLVPGRDCEGNLRLLYKNEFV